MLYRFIKIYLCICVCLVLLVSCQGSSGEQAASPNKEVIEKLVQSMEHGTKKEQCEALFALHPYGKEAIPYLIDKIDIHVKQGLFLGDPRSSLLLMAGEPRWMGELFAYTIEVILAREKLGESDCSDTKWLFSFKSWDEHWDAGGKIWKEKETEDDQSIFKGSRILTYEDMVVIKSSYLQWFEKSQDKDIMELHEEYIKRDRPLKDSKYYWFH